MNGQYAHNIDAKGRLFIPTNVFRKEFSVPPVTKRTYPIYINYGYTDTDSIRIQLPEGYVIEGLPKPLDVKSKFGSFHSGIQVKDKEIYITHRLFMRKGFTVRMNMRHSLISASKWQDNMEEKSF